MTLSVVVPARDAAETLAETLDSLLAQTRGDWEAIVVDDGSIDSTREVAEAFAARDRRFRVLSDGRPAEGVAAARNRGIAEARGQWLHFLDSDDWIEPAFVEKMVGALEARPGRRLAFCSNSNVALDGRRGEPWLSTRIARAPFETLARDCPLPIHSVVFDANLVQELGGFDVTMSAGEDSDFWQRVARAGVTFFPVPQAVVFYRARRNSLSTGARRRLAAGRTVIERAFAPDPRVPNPDPRYAAGASGGSDAAREMALAYFMLWNAAFDIGEGSDGKGMVSSLPSRSSDVLEECRVQILGGLAAGLRVPIDDSFSPNPAFVAAVRSLLEQVEQAAQWPGLARLLECALEQEIFRPARLTERLAVGNSLFVRQDVSHLQAIDVLPGVDRLHVEFRAGTRCLGHADVVMLGAFSVRELTATAIDSIGPMLFLKENGLWWRPRLWLRAAIEVARLPFHLLGARPWRGPNSVLRARKLARKVLVGAAIDMAGPPTSATHQRALAALALEGAAQAGAPEPQARAALEMPVDAARPPIDHRHEMAGRLPILMYHRIAEDGPASLVRYRTSPAAFSAQMRWLRRQGYHAITSSDLVRHWCAGRPLKGRPVLITFDDGYRDFHDVAWPILRAEGFSAEVFVVTDLVGRTAEWDASEGQPAPLMDWTQIRSLAAAGVHFGSHMATHHHMASLSSREIVLEAARSRAQLERRLDRRCVSIAAPFGESDDCFVHIAAQCGYQVGFTAESGAAGLDNDLLRLPRIEVPGGWSLDTFAGVLSRKPL
jgi:peptidoglycan/xylan/chitin deacetylase (PgdA/CDA1 family)/GT2 family glycosyltransferase